MQMVLNFDYNWQASPGLISSCHLIKYSLNAYVGGHNFARET